MISDRKQKLAALLNLSHALGCEDRRMAILAEGNTSAKLSAEAFLVKASGSNLGKLDANGLVECRAQPLIDLLTKKNLADNAVDQALLDARVDQSAKKPSVEALFHAYLLSLPETNFIGHTHAQAVNSILCSPRAKEF